jgi:glycosyltransferase involved in cell wall biosynthesis
VSFGGGSAPPPLAGTQGIRSRDAQGFPCSKGLRLAVYTDYAYRRRGDRLYAERAFALFLVSLAAQVERMEIIGRLAPDDGQARYRIPARIGFTPLVHYQSLARPGSALVAMARSLRRLWRSLDRVDVVWALGPHPLAMVLVAMARLRGRRVALGVRQDLPAYTRSRHPGRRGLQLAANALDAIYRLLARRLPTVVVGPALKERYLRSRRLLELSVSLVSKSEIAASARAGSPRYDGELRLLSVGRLEQEKNPLLLADALAGLATDGVRWRLTVCGEGPLEGPLRTRLRELGVLERAELRGYVPLDGGLRDAYRESHFLLHVSWTEGLPQVLVEAFAAGLPVVATDVGGIGEAVGGAVRLVPPGDAGAIGEALRALARDEGLRRKQVEEGFAYARRHTTEREVRQLVSFLAGASPVDLGPSVRFGL